MKKKKTLYDCSHARVQGRRIYCNKGYPLSPQPGNGHVDIQHLAEGKPLAPKVCQQCGDFDRMGSPVPEEERGWLNVKETIKHDATNWEALREPVA